MCDTLAGEQVPGLTRHLCERSPTTPPYTWHANTAPFQRSYDNYFNTFDTANGYTPQTHFCVDDALYAADPAGCVTGVDEWPHPAASCGAFKAATSQSECESVPNGNVWTADTPAFCGDSGGALVDGVHGDRDGCELARTGYRWLLAVEAACVGPTGESMLGVSTRGGCEVEGTGSGWQAAEPAACTDTISGLVVDATCAGHLCGLRY
jgi:hypothetical protein